MRHKNYSWTSTLFVLISIIWSLMYLSGESKADSALYQAQTCYPRDSVSVLWSSQGDKLAISGQTSITILDDTYQVIQTISTDEISSALAWHPEGALIAGALRGSNAIQVWNANTANLEYTLSVSDRGGVSDIDWHPGGKMLASGHWSIGVRPVVYIWDITSETIEGMFTDPFVEILDVEWDKTGDFLAVSNLRDNGGLFIINFDLDVSVTRIGNMGEANFLAWSPDNTMLVSESVTPSQTALHIWETQAFVMTHIYEFDRDHNFSAIQWNPDNSQIAVLDYQQSEILIIEIPSGEVIATLESGTNRDLIPLEHMSLAWHPNGDQLVEAGCDNKLRVWDMNTYELIKTIDVNELMNE